VLDWIEMDVIDVPFQIALIADGVFPEPALPERVFAVLAPSDWGTCLHDRRREPAFDQVPPVRIVRIVGRKRHDDVQVLWQHHDRFDREGMSMPGNTKRGAQRIDVIDQHARPSIREREGEEICAARDEIPPISNHGGDL
jgi:hypothetical protein